MKKNRKNLLALTLALTMSAGMVGMTACDPGVFAWQEASQQRQTQYTVTIHQNIPTAGYVVGAGTYRHGRQANLLATPKEGFKFAGWKKGDTFVSRNASYTFTVTDDVDIWAIWEYDNFVVSVNDGGYGTVSGAGSYSANSAVTLSATGNLGYIFDGWYDGATCVSTDSVYTFAATKNVNLTAKWRGITPASEYTWYDGKTKEDCYTEDMQTKYFFSDRDDAVTYFANAMYHDFGNLTESHAPYAAFIVGWTPAWYEWISLTRNWYDNPSSKSVFRGYMINQPICEDGYVWSYDTTHWPNMGSGGSCLNGDCHNYHYDNNFRYIISVCNFVGWENSLDLLDTVDELQEPNHIDQGNESNSSFHLADDASKGKTVGEKLDMAINYVLENLEGKNGLVIIGEDENDGLNVGTSESYSCNYWDNIPFGYKSAYENILFYNSLKSLVELETFRGNTSKAEYYADLMAQVKENYNETFWSEETGRYIATVDIDGVERDYGITFVNTEAVAAGLASAEQAKSIYDWLDGKRVVESDDIKGEDIYIVKTTSRKGVVTIHSTVVPVSNTVDYGRSIAGTAPWWHDNGGSMALDGAGAFKQHVENGGAILYTEFYDIMGRVQMGDTASAYHRMEVLAEEFAKDELNRDPNNWVASPNLLGFIGEFPESGLVPTAYLYGFIGLSQMAGGLRFNPQIPEGYEYMGANDIVFGEDKYKVTTYRDGKFIMECGADLNMTVALKDVSSVGTRTVTFYAANGSVITSQQVTAANGEFLLNLKGVAGAVKAVVA